MRLANCGQSDEEPDIQHLFVSRYIDSWPPYIGAGVMNQETVGHDIFWRPFHKNPRGFLCYRSRNASRFGALREFARERQAWGSVCEFLGVRGVQKLHWE